MNWVLRIGSSNGATQSLRTEEFFDLIHSGIVTPEDDIKREGDLVWKKGWEYPDLAQHFSPFPSKESGDDDHIDMNALIDVCLVLLVFFLIVTSYARLIQHLEATKNQNNQAAPTLQANQIDRMVRIRIEKKGAEIQYLLNGTIILENQLVENLRIAGKTAGKKDLLLEYPDDVPYETVIKVQDAARGADFQQILQVSPEKQP